MSLEIAGFSEVLTILKDLLNGLKTVSKLPDEKRREMRDALADTAELIDETLTIVKQHLTQILNELQYGDNKEAKKLIYEVGNFQEWEERYRKFQLCDKLHTAALNLEKKGLYSKLLKKISLHDPDTIQMRMWDYVGGETKAANSVGTMLKNLAELHSKVDSNLTIVVLRFEEARDEVGKWRQDFINIEKEIRNLII